MSPIRPSLGAPGIYACPEPEPPALAGVRMDVCAFVGVAPRGPVRLAGTNADGKPIRRRSVAVAVESFAHYRRLFGGFEGPGRLPFAVASFFEQGGRRAYVVRIVHDYGDDDDEKEDVEKNGGGVARGELPAGGGSIALRAANEGSWGNDLRAALGFTVEPLEVSVDAPGELVVDGGESLPPGALLRFRLPAPELRFVTGVRRSARPDGRGTVLRATLDHGLPDLVDPESVRQAEVVEGVLAVEHPDGLAERHERLGLSALHPRWLATVLDESSELLRTDPSRTTAAEILPGDARRLPREPVPETESLRFSEGVDRYPDIEPEDFFDDGWTAGDPDHRDGVHALAHLADLSAVVVPDLYCPEPLPPAGSALAEASLAGGEFAPCADADAEPREQEEASAPLERLHLDPRRRRHRDAIIALQSRLVDLAERLSSFVVLLDVPPGLARRQILAWRAHFRSSYAAAYHPWLGSAPPEAGREAPVLVNPSAAAAGILARQELAFGVPHGPANVLVRGVVDVAEAVPAAHHDQLHLRGINVFLKERDGVRLTAGRTLASDPRLRQLSVRRLLLMLRRVLEQQTHWMVFEPNGAALRAQVRQMLRGYLRQLYLAGAFRGATAEEAFFVRCDRELNPPRVADAGRLVAEIGVAPAEPVEFIVLRLLRQAAAAAVVEAG